MIYRRQSNADTHVCGLSVSADMSAFLSNMVVCVCVCVCVVLFWDVCVCVGCLCLRMSVSSRPGPDLVWAILVCICVCGIKNSVVCVCICVCGFENSFACICVHRQAQTTLSVSVHVCVRLTLVTTTNNAFNSLQ